jgi:hypothetical protein
LSAPTASLGGGYNAALGSLNKALGLLQGSDTSQMMQAQNQLTQSQGKTQQGLINSGLGNTTVAQTLQQAPLQTYNQNVQGIQNNLAKDQASVLGQGAQLQAGGGAQMSQLLAALQAQQMQQQPFGATHPTGNVNRPTPGAAGF